MNSLGSGNAVSVEEVAALSSYDHRYLPYKPVMPVEVVGSVSVINSLGDVSEHSITTTIAPGQTLESTWPPRDDHVASALGMVGVKVLR